MSAHFSCSKCRKPLAVDGDIVDASPAAFDMLRGALRTARPVSQHKPYPAVREALLHDALADSTATIVPAKPSTQRATPAAQTGSGSARHNAPSESFVLLTQSEDDGIAAQDSLSHKLERTRRLFDALSANSAVDHPVCDDCTELLVRGMNKEMGELARQRDAYITYLKRVKEGVPTHEEQDKAQAELAELERQEEIALEELRKAEAEHTAMLAELHQLERENAQLDEEEAAFWQMRNSFTQELDAVRDERDSVDLRFEHDARLLEKLQKTNVFNDTFCIGHDGHFGTINGLRLGRLSTIPVEWAEINAAWGLTLLLLQTMAERLKYTFVGYKLHPLGSTSTIERIEQDGRGGGGGGGGRSTMLELYGNTDLNPIKYWQKKSFDQAQVAFLECLRQLGEFVEKKDPTVQLPYKIHKDTIADACIKTGFNGEEHWTRALKFCLTNAKWLLAVLVKNEQGFG